MIHMTIISFFIFLFSKIYFGDCSICHLLTIELVDNTQNRMGFFNNLEFKCTSCDQWRYSVYSSKECVKTNNKTTGINIFKAYCFSRDLSGSCKYKHIYSMHEHVWFNQKRF